MSGGYNMSKDASKRDYYEKKENREILFNSIRMAMYIMASCLSFIAFILLITLILVELAG